MSCDCIMSYFTKHDFDACLLIIIFENFISYSKLDEIKCERCNRIGHESNDCYSRRYENGIEIIDNRCNKCYRNNHKTRDCKSIIDINGNYLI